MKKDIKFPIMVYKKGQNFEFSENLIYKIVNSQEELDALKGEFVYKPKKTSGISKKIEKEADKAIDEGKKVLNKLPKLKKKAK